MTKLNSMNAKEFLKQVSPNDKFGIRADLKATKLEKHVIDIMERYAALRIHDVVGRSEQLCECDAPLIRTSDKGGEYCGLCQNDLD